MIQRIQSIWLLLAAVAAFLGFKLSFYSGNMLSGTAKVFYHLTATGNLGVLVLTVATGIMALIAIFLYKNRKLQMRLTLGAFIISLLTIVLYYYQSQKFVPAEGSYNITAIITILVPAFLLMAARGINSDQKLVKSLDRLR